MYSTEYKDIRSIISQSPHEKTTSKLSILGLYPRTGAASPYLIVACGEPRDVWWSLRLLLFINN